MDIAVLFWSAIVVAALVGGVAVLYCVSALLLMGAERRDHSWKTWGLDEKTEEKDENRR